MNHPVFAVERSIHPTGMGGTLVSFVAANGALVVAADSRSTTLGTRCDGRVKLVVPASPSHTIIAGTGTSEWISARVPLWPDDPCGDLEKNGITFFDSKAIALNFLEAKKQPVWALDLKELADHLIKAIIQVAQSNLAYVQGFAGKVMFQLVLGGLDPDTGISFVRAVQFSMSEQFAIQATVSADYKFTESSLPDYPHFGDTIAVTTHVMLGDGKKHLPASLERVRAKQTVADVSVEDASDLAINLIEAAKLTSVEVPELLSIGGDVTAYVIDVKGTRRIK